MAIEKTIIIKTETKEATKNIQNLSDGVKGVGKSSTGAKKGLTEMKGSTDKLGLSFKALGIGLIVTAFMKLKDLFSGNIETARKFEVAGAKISAMFDVLRDRLEPLFMSLSKLFTAYVHTRTSFTLTFGVTTSATGDTKYTGTAWISSLSLTAPLEDSATYSASFTGSGALTQTIA